jgi:integrase
MVTKLGRPPLGTAANWTQGPQQERDKYGELGQIIPAWHISLQSHYPQKSVATYLVGPTQMADFLRTMRMPLSPEGLAREHIEAFLLYLRTTPSCRGTPRKPNTVLTYYMGLLAFFKWCQEEGIIEEARNPMRHVKPPKVLDEPAQVLSDAQVRKLLRLCEGKGFEQRRNMALVAVLVDTGVRIGELGGLRIADIEWDVRMMQVRGKTGARYCRLSRQVVNYLNLYVNLSRAKHRQADSEWLWLGSRGRLGTQGIHAVLKALGERAGIPGLHAHQFRHYCTHVLLEAGIQEGDLKVLMGWDPSSEMPYRYAKGLAQQRALSAHERFSPLKRLSE